MTATAPNPKVLRRVPLDAKETELRQACAALIATTVDIGTDAFVWCAEAKDKPEHFGVPMLLMRHTLQFADAVSILIASSGADPCAPLLRSMFEALLAIDFLLHDSTERRAAAFQVVTVHKMIRDLQRADPSTEVGKQAAELSKQDKIMVGFTDFPPSTKPQVQRLQAFLKQAALAGVEAEYQKADRRTRKNWYTLSDGIGSIEQLAGAVKRSGTYEYLYRHWSDAAHANITTKGMVAHVDGSLFYTPLRTTTELKTCCDLCVTVLWDALDMMVRNFAPEKTTGLALLFMLNISPYLAAKK